MLNNAVNFIQETRNSYDDNVLDNAKSLCSRWGIPNKFVEKRESYAKKHFYDNLNGDRRLNTTEDYDYYPIGHPDKISEPKVFDKNWFGLIKCKVLPPNNLYHPVLPIKVKMEKNVKLLFPLCYKCASEQIKKCTHSEGERQFIGTWTTDEIK
ncbi:unnamed protein product [Macrosiphum euphorbiae]|uniref:Uncharacterized protein n=1 Tax=Macrosiphum euphorbiae TaxID=13131 RepID=A0AAV0WEQ1_9HEMI|nr:unnamed protein product [Macrosiphum euphorbiae]